MYRKKQYVWGLVLSAVSGIHWGVRTYPPWMMKKNFRTHIDSESLLQGKRVQRDGKMGRQRLRDGDGAER